MLIKSLNLLLYLIFVRLTSSAKFSCELIDERKIAYDKGLNKAVQFIVEDSLMTGVLVIHDGSDMDSLGMFVKEIQKTATIAIWRTGRQFNQAEVMKKRTLVIYYLETLSTLTEKLLVTSRLRGKTRVILICKNGKECPSVELHRIFEVIWKMELTRTHVLNVNSQNGSGVAELYTYYPFDNYACGRSYVRENIAMLGIFDYAKIELPDFYQEVYDYDPKLFYKRLYDYNKIFRSKIPMSYNNCSLRIGSTPWHPFVVDWKYIDQPGMECEFIRDVARVINASIDVVFSHDESFGTRKKDGMWTAKEGLLQQKQIDLIIGGIYTSVDRPADFETSHWYLPNTFTWFVPTPKRIAKSQIMWLVVTEKKMQAILVVSIFAVTSTLIYIIGFLEAQIKPKSNDKSFFGMLMILEAMIRGLIGTPSTNLPSSHLIRLILGLWFASCVILGCFFNTTMISYIAHPGVDKPLQSAEDIIKSKINVVYYSGYETAICALYKNCEYFNERYRNASVNIALKIAASRRVLNNF